MRAIACALAALLATVLPPLRAAEVTIVEEGKARAAIFVSARVMDDAIKNKEPDRIWTTLKAEDNRRRLRESVKDLAAVLERVSGARTEIVIGKPVENEKRLPILIGELATERFGKPARSYPYRQGCRITVTPTGIGLSGESDLGASYAIYTLLEQIGCRWYMPGPLGEALPAAKLVKLPEQDTSTGPGTICRGIWYTDNDHARRHRMGGMILSAGHALEFTVPKELREKHPEIRAIVEGKADAHKVKWTHPLVAQAIADACIAAARKDPDMHTWSLSPDDGLGWDESDDTKFDAGDIDPVVQVVSKTDRLMVLANRVAEKVAPDYPDIKFGILAYADYIRPPVRAKIHPSIVPQIAPITFSRAHPMSDDGEPNNKSLRALVEGWGKAVPATSWYFYCYNLAEASSPNPMITKWGQDIPFIYKEGKCKYWQPETLTNFETSMHAHCLGLRLAWDPDQVPRAIVDELHEKFYGHAGRQMAAYWQFIDDVWVKTPEYAGCGFGHLRRWNLDKLKMARQLMTDAEKACVTDMEKERVRIASLSLKQFELYMKMRRDLADGKLATLADDIHAYRQRSIDLGKKYEASCCFTRMSWTGDETLNVRYFDSFCRATYDDAVRISRDFEILTQPPVRKWRFCQDREKKGEAGGWMKTDFDDSPWKTTDVAVDSWSALGLHNYLGSLWYRAAVKLPAAPSGKKTFLWIGSTDGRVKVFVNGKHVPYVGPKQEKADGFSGFCQPASFDVTDAVRAGDNQISLLCTREAINELGTGGLLAAPMFYREK
jgi:hypothetical protein